MHFICIYKYEHITLIFLKKIPFRIHPRMPLEVWLPVPSIRCPSKSCILQVPLFLSVILGHFFQVTFKRMWFFLFSKEIWISHNARLLYYLVEVPDTSSKVITIFYIVFIYTVVFKDNFLWLVKEWSIGNAKSDSSVFF